ncbi:MAG: HEAT repeat domain-containing protein, partial [Ignavibacteriae bacterium]|nr:HEAT repeat domain-containing protein [Ignavibacteriota bacterium]
MTKQTSLIFLIIIITISSSFSQDVKDFDIERVKSLINQFSDKDPWVNGDAINELVLIGEPVVDYLIESLQNKDDNVRWCSAITLEKISPLGKQSIPFLTGALKDKYANVRWCSALALGKYGKDAGI